MNTQILMPLFKRLAPLAFMLPEGAEKSVFTKNLLLNQNQMIFPQFSNVYWIYKTLQSELFQELQKQNSFIIEFLNLLMNQDL